MLTDENDLVVDIFAGSCTTGEVCDNLHRRWLGFELDRNYVANSIFRFILPNIALAKSKSCMIE